MLWPVLPHCGSTAPKTAVVPLPGENQNSPKHLLWKNHTATLRYHRPAVLPPSNARSYRSARKPKSHQYLLWNFRTAKNERYYWPAVLPFLKLRYYRFPWEIKAPKHLLWNNHTAMNQAVLPDFSNTDSQQRYYRFTETLKSLRPEHPATWTAQIHRNVRTACLSRPIWALFGGPNVPLDLDHPIKI